MQTTTQVITEKLNQIAVDNDVRILYACESGSRAWGFASPDSDYDVRFIYVQNKSAYLSIQQPRDVIELPVNEVLDISGWDIKKAFALFYKSNSALYEWLQSPVMYKVDETFLQKLKGTIPDFYSPLAGLNHYASMTKSTFEGDLQNPQVKLKKYFYALRPVLAAKWILEKNTCPPMEFEPLRVILTDTSVQNAIEDLLKQKATSDEKTLITQVPVLQNFIAQTLEEITAQKSQIKDFKGDIETLNDFFRATLA